MTKTIHQLDSITIDKIAAGEVIESPASCIKELIDNSLDAGARSITIEIQLGGREKIVVRDDGKGMSQEDLAIAYQRHTTSKIQSIDDLERLMTLGFRGEALSSISSIAKVTIRSRPKNEKVIDRGAEITIEGGVPQPIREVQAPIGTEITVESLFYNVPARRKFLKSPSQNGLEVIKLVKQLALISPHVAFSVISDKKEVFHVAQEDSFEARIKAVVQEPYRTKGIPLSHTKEGISISGMLAMPECSKKTRSGQYLFVNNRPVLAPTISYTVKSAYASSIPSDQHPQFVLSITVDPDRVDINVHPQKKEIRFADEEWVRAELYSAIGQALFSISPSESIYVPSYSNTSNRWYEPQETTFEREPRYTQGILWEQEAPPLEAPSYSHLLHIGRFALGTIQEKYVLVDLTKALQAISTHSIQKSNDSSLLLVPETIELDTATVAHIEERLSWFHSLGFTLSLFGNNTILLEGIPSYLNATTAKAFLQELIDREVAGKDLLLDTTQELLSTLAIQSFPELQEKQISEALAEHIIAHWTKASMPPCTMKGKKVYVFLEPSTLMTLFNQEPS